MTPIRPAIPLLLLTILLTVPGLRASELSVVGGFAPVEDLVFEGSRFDFDRVGIFGGRFESEFLMVLGFENSLLFGSNLLQVPGNPDSNGFYYTSNLVLNLPNGRFVPNLALGVGFLHRGGDSFPDSGTSFLTNWGVGLKLRNLAGPFGLRFDYRRINVRDVIDQDLLLQELTAGVLFSF